MSLTLIATPIGHPEELSLSAQKSIPELDVLICESRKETSKLMRQLGIKVKSYLELNEHSGGSDIQELIEICRSQNVGLVSDCGTPGFCDPGALLVRKCRDLNIPVRSLPGPSSLMAFFSVCGYRVDEFYFKGFLSANTAERSEQLIRLKKNYFCPIILMDTPYRMQKLLKELAETWSDSYVVLGCQLGMAEEVFFEGSAKSIPAKITMEKAEFMLMVASTRADLMKGFTA